MQISVSLIFPFEMSFVTIVSEVREFRNLSKRLVEAEERSNLLRDLLKNRVCLGEEEKFLHSNIPF